MVLANSDFSFQIIFQGKVPHKKKFYVRSKNLDQKQKSILHQIMKFDLCRGYAGTFTNICLCPCFHKSVSCRNHQLQGTVTVRYSTYFPYLPVYCGWLVLPPLLSLLHPLLSQRLNKQKRIIDEEWMTGRICSSWSTINCSGLYLTYSATLPLEDLPSSRSVSWHTKQTNTLPSIDFRDFGGTNSFKGDRGCRPMRYSYPVPVPYFELERRKI
jgi:hypothetical protein